MIWWNVSTPHDFCAFTFLFPLGGEQYGIKTYCYTARSDLDFSDCRELTVNGSGWMAHNRFQVAYRLDREDGKPIAIDKNDDPVACSHVCPGKCGPCSLCSEKAGNAIAVKLH